MLSMKFVILFSQMNVVMKAICKQMFNIKYPSHYRINNIWNIVLFDVLKLKIVQNRSALI